MVNKTYQLVIFINFSSCMIAQQKIDYYRALKFHNNKTLIPTMSPPSECLKCSTVVSLVTSILFFIVSINLMRINNDNELIIKENYIVCANRAKFENTVKNLIDFDTKHYGNVIHTELNNKLFFQNFGSEDICLSKYIFDDISKLDKTIAKSIRNDLEILELLLSVTNEIIANENNKTTVENETVVDEIIVKDVLDESADVIEL